MEDSTLDTLSNLRTTALAHARIAVDEGQFAEACQHYNAALHPNPRVTAEQRTAEYNALNSDLKKEALLGKVAAFCNSVLREPKTPPLITHVADAVSSYHSYIRNVENSPETHDYNRWAMLALLLAIPTQKEISPQQELIADQPKPNAGAKTRLDRAAGIMTRNEEILFKEPLSDNAKNSTVQAARAAFLLHLALQAPQKNDTALLNSYLSKSAQICQSLTQYRADDPICSQLHLMEVLAKIAQFLDNQSSKNLRSGKSTKFKNKLKRLSRNEKKQPQLIAQTNAENIQDCLNRLVKGLIVGSTLFRSLIQGELQDLRQTNERNLVVAAQPTPADRSDEDEKHQGDETPIDDPYTAYLELPVLFMPDESAGNNPIQVPLSRKHKHRFERILAEYLILLKELKKSNFSISICFKCAICLNDYLVRYGNNPKQAKIIAVLQQKLQAIGEQIEMPAENDFSQKAQTARLTAALFWDTLGDTYTLTASPQPPAKHNALAEEAYKIAGNIWLHSCLVYYLFNMSEQHLSASERQERNQNLCLLDDHFKKCPPAPYPYGIDHYEITYKPSLADVEERLTRESPALLQQPVYLIRLRRIDKTITIVPLAASDDLPNIASSISATACPPNVVGRSAGLFDKSASNTTSADHLSAEPF